MTRLRLLVGLVVCISLGATAPAHADAVTDWNARTLSCSGANRPGVPALLDVALVQAAVHDAVQAIQGRFEAYRYDNPARRGLGSPAAAAAAASYRMLVGLYGADNACLVGAVDPAVTYARDAGLQAGYEAAAVLLPLYRPFFVLPTDPFLGGTDPGEWRPTPGVTQGVNTFMAETEPFVVLSPSQFRSQPPDPLKSDAYLREYNEVKELGAIASTTRTAEQTDMARFWTAPPSQWFGALRAIADAHVPDIGDKARLLALCALAAADGQITVYDSKYFYNFWRPSTAIQEGDNDTNARTVGDPTWTPFLLDPPYPDHPSGANNLTGAVTTILQLFFGTDEFEFSVSSPNPGLVVNPRSFSRFSDAAREVVEVRILQGIHFRRAEVLGRLQGARVANWTFQRFLRSVCDGQVATIVGTEDNNVLLGTEGNDVIVGLGGNDGIRGLGSKDVICGGPGDDVIEGGSGHDLLLGERGSDVLDGGMGGDQLLGGLGNDTLLGGPDADELYGGTGDDTMNGGTESDFCVGGSHVSGDTAVNCEAVQGAP